jgi:hypothetical protein
MLVVVGRTTSVRTVQYGPGAGVLELCRLGAVKEPLTISGRVVFIASRNLHS